MRNSIKRNESHETPRLPKEEADADASALAENGPDEGEEDDEEELLLLLLPAGEHWTSALRNRLFWRC